MPLTITQPTGGVMSSLDAGAITSGSINQMITDSGPLAAGNAEPWAYKILTVTFQTGTTDSNLANILVNIGGTNTGGIISAGTTIGKLQSGTQFSIQEFRVLVSSGQHVYLTIGNSAPGAGSIYNASMSVTRLYSKYDL